MFRSERRISQDTLIGAAWSHPEIGERRAPTLHWWAGSSCIVTAFEGRAFAPRLTEPSAIGAR